MATNRLVEKGKVEIYARTLFDVLRDSGEEALVEVRNQMQVLLHLIYADIDLAYALDNPDYEPEQRYALAQAVFADADPALREILAAMAKNGDASMVSRVYHALEDLMTRELNLCVVDVTTAVPLDDKLRQQIKEKTEADLGCKAMLNESIDQSILGGIVMSVNGMRIDASVISQLNHARHLLKENDGGETSD